MGIRGRIDFINAPIIGFIKVKNTDIKAVDILTPTKQDIQGIGCTGVIDIVALGAEVDIVFGSKLTRSPAPRLGVPLLHTGEAPRPGAVSN